MKIKQTVNLIDMGVTGLSAKELDACSFTRDPDELPNDIVFHPAVRSGDVWQLGDHRIICGDSTNFFVVKQLLGNNHPILLCSDPPYGISYDPNWREDYDGTKRASVGLVKNDDRADWRDAWRLFTGDVAYIWHAIRKAGIVWASLEASGFEIRDIPVWIKQKHTFGRGAYHSMHEPVFYAVRRGRTSNWQGDRKQTTVWEIRNANPMGGDKSQGTSGHGTQKPIECMARPIRHHTVRGDWVYDPFLGSGTTLIACEMEGRRCLGVEIDPRYVYLTIARWQFLTGRQATMGGETFAEVAARRLKDPVVESVAEATFPQYQPDFDPALALWELRFCPRGGAVVDLEEEGSATRAAAARQGGIHPAAPGEPADLLLAHPRPPGAAGYGDFLGGLLGDLREAAGRLRDGRFAVLAAPEVEWTDGLPCGFPVHLHQAACEAGLRFYGGTVYEPEAGERLQIMVFCKGDPKVAEAVCGGVG